MKKTLFFVLCLALFLCACGQKESATTDPTETYTVAITYGTIPVTEEVLVPEETTQAATEDTLATEATESATGATEPSTEATEPATTAPIQATEPATEPTTVPTEATEAVTESTEPVSHSELYIPGVSVEDVIRWFNEVALDAEFTHGGNASLVQKWVSPVRYYIEGEPTETDYQVLANFCYQLNCIPGFPGIQQVDAPLMANMFITFCTTAEFADKMGSEYAGLDGAVRFNYNGANQIFSANICYATNIDQYTRNSVLQEEIYNGLGPVQDTWLRADSLIYAGYSTPQAPTGVDLLILKLLYHPEIKCGMTAAQCEQVIRSLYY